MIDRHLHTGTFCDMPLSREGPVGNATAKDEADPRWPTRLNLVGRCNRWQSGIDRHSSHYRETIVHAPELKKLLAAAAGFTPQGSMIAGGALTSIFTGQPINDVDLYFKSKDAFIAAVHEAYDRGLWCVWATDRAITFKYGELTIQFMHFDYFVDAPAVFHAFDFTVCMAAYDIDSEAFVFHDDFFKHASQRYLKFHSGTRFPFGSLLRIMKYQARGYTLGKGDLLRIALCCHEVPLNSWEDLAAAIGGQYGERVSLETDEPFSVPAAIALIANSEFTVSAVAEEMPGSADELLEKLGISQL